MGEMVDTIPKPAAVDRAEIAVIASRSGGTTRRLGRSPRHR